MPADGQEPLQAIETGPQMAAGANMEFKLKLMNN